MADDRPRLLTTRHDPGEPFTVSHRSSVMSAIVGDVCDRSYSRRRLIRMEEMTMEPEDELMYAAIEETARRVFEGNDFSLVGVIEDAKGERQIFDIGPESETEAMARARREVTEREARAFAVIGLGSMEAEEEIEGEGDENGQTEIPVLVVYRQGSGDAQVEVYVAPFSVGPDEEGDDSMEIGELESHGVLPESWLG